MEHLHGEHLEIYSWLISKGTCAAWEVHRDEAIGKQQPNGFLEVAVVWGPAEGVYGCLGVSTGKVGSTGQEKREVVFDQAFLVCQCQGYWEVERLRIHLSDCVECEAGVQN